MRLNPDRYRLSFLMPANALHALALGRHAPSAEGCELVVHRAGLVIVTGPSREAIFEHVAPFLRTALWRSRPDSFGAVLITPASADVPSGRDGWSIIVGADVAFSPTSMPPHIAEAEARAPPLTLVRDIAR